jgi:transcription antitermination protein NusB
MSSNNRRVGRECALKILFALRLDEQADAERLLSQFWQGFRFADDALGEPLETVDNPLPEATRSFAETLVKGVVEYRAVIDQELREVAKNWSLERMATVDLSILRICSYELLYQPDVPKRVALNEAIEIAKRYGTKESPSFVNGLLDKVAQRVRKDKD